LPLRNQIRRAIDQVCGEQSLILGPHVERLEKDLAEYCGTKHAIGVFSATDALLCALIAIGSGGVKPADEVIVPAFTFCAPAVCVARLGAKPVYCDIDPGTSSMDDAEAAKRVAPKTRVIVPVRLFGQCANMEAINDLASSHKLKVIEDAAQAIGA